MSGLQSSLENKEKILLTMALPYANGSAHVGHLLGFIQSDIYARFLKLIGKDCVYVSASDMHGTPIMVNAKKNNMAPRDFVEKYHQEFQEVFKKYLIGFDKYYHTDSPENKELAELFFKTLKDRGYIYTKEIEQLYDKEAKQFLPDRFIKGTCPKCGAEDQYGDACEKCGTFYEPTELVHPKSTITGSTPVIRKTTHYYFKLTEFADVLKTWINDESSHIQKEIKNWLDGWLDQGLKDWCISRDDPYFGFEIPGSADETGEKKYFYVWLDAPIGYISSSENYLAKKGGSWKDYWQNKNSQVMHFIGKDIVYFHFLFWPAMLHAMNISLPQLSVNGFITIDGKKMSKSRGTFFTAEDFYGQFGGEKLRFYFASHSQRSVQDINLDLQDFKAVSNNVFMGSLGNFCFRTMSFAAKNYASGFERVADGVEEQAFRKEFDVLVSEIKSAYYEQDFKTAVKSILKISDKGNAYFQKLEPWKVREAEAEKKEVASKIAFMVNIAKNLSILVKPIVPDFSAKIEKAFGPEVVLLHDNNGLQWSDLCFDHTGAVSVPEKLVEKVEIKEKKEGEEVFPLDIRVGQIIEVKDHPSAEKLYVFQVDFGDFGKRQIVAGLKNDYSSEDLLHKKTLFLVNLEPAKIRDVESAGMSLVAEDKEKKITLLWQDESAVLGTQASFGMKSNSAEVDFKQFQKIKMKVLSGKVVWKEKVLKVDTKDVEVTGVDDGAKIC